MGLKTGTKCLASILPVGREAPMLDKRTAVCDPVVLALISLA